MVDNKYFEATYEFEDFTDTLLTEEHASRCPSLPGVCCCLGERVPRGRESDLGARTYL